MKSKILSIFSSIGALITGICGSACGAVCLSGGCCGGIFLFGIIGLSGSTLQFFEKLTPVFLVLTVLGLSYGFYKAYKSKPVECCGTTNDKSENSCCTKEKKESFFQSKSFLWATALLCTIMWIYSFANKLNDNTGGCTSSSNVIDTTSSPFIMKYSWE